jgi:hypothetical protein
MYHSRADMTELTVKGGVLPKIMGLGLSRYFTLINAMTSVVNKLN